MLGEKKLSSKEMWVNKIFGSLQILGPKNFGSEKFWVWKILSPQNLRVKKKCWAQKLSDFTCLT